MGTLGERLRDLRSKNGITQAELAEKMDKAEAWSS